jgi:aminopeptidase N
MSLLGASATPLTVARGSSLTIVYEIECSDNVSNEIWLGASFCNANNRLFYNTSEDKAVSITKGRSAYERKFTIARDAPPGEQRLDAGLWRGTVGSSQSSKWIAGTSIEIKIT